MDKKSEGQKRVEVLGKDIFLNIAPACVYVYNRE